MKKIISVLFALVINFFILNTAYAENYYIQNFHIQNYNVLMKVKENREIDVTESFDVYFTQKTKGICRIIPLRKLLQLNDGTKILEKGKVTNVEASDYFRESEYQDDYYIYLGHTHSFVSGQKQYKIKYTYKINDEHLNNFDEFYFNIIGNKWNTQINHVNFKIVMPKDFDESKMEFSIGEYNQADYNHDFLKIDKTNNVILGYTLGPLKDNEGITIRIELPDGYFQKGIDQEKIILALVLILALISLGVWYKYGKDDVIIPVVNFYPPEGRNSAELEVEYSGKSTNNGIVSLIFYLANKGYLEIENDGISYTFNKLKDYDGKKSSERALMRALFPKDKLSVSLIELQSSYEYSRYCHNIKESLKRIKRSIFEKESMTAGKIFTLFGSILLTAFAIIYALGDYSFEIIRTTHYVAFCPLIAICVLAFAVNSKQYEALPFLLLWAAIFGGVSGLFVAGISVNLQNNLPVIITGIISLIISFVCFLNLPKRNRQGREVLGHILGFKKFIESVEKRRLQKIIDENPSYCDDVLPFAYALGVIDSWLDNLNGIVYTPPKWYKGEEFDIKEFNTLAKSIEKAAYHKKSS